jgi:hypothetical protein
MSGTPDFEKNRSLVFRGDMETAQIRVPSDCVPHFAKETSRKERILKTIEATMKNELTLFNTSGGTHYPSHLRIVVANFKLDYPETLVFIPSTEQVFHVTLHDSADPLSDAFLNQGEYPVRPEYDQQAVKVQREKIMRYGIVREITLGSG